MSTDSICADAAEDMDEYEPGSFKCGKGGVTFVVKHTTSEAMTKDQFVDKATGECDKYQDSWNKLYPTSSSAKSSSSVNMSSFAESSSSAKSSSSEKSSSSVKSSSSEGSSKSKPDSIGTCSADYDLYNLNEPVVWHFAKDPAVSSDDILESDFEWSFGSDASPKNSTKIGSSDSVAFSTLGYKFPTLRVTLPNGDIYNIDCEGIIVVDAATGVYEDDYSVTDLRDGHEYYKAKSGALVRVTRDNGQWCFEGGWQMEKNHKRLYVNNGEIFTKVNGKSYQLNEQMPLPAQNSVYLTMKNNEEFSEFYDLFTDEAANLMSSTMHGSEAAMSKTQGNKNITLMDNYNYNIYIPTNESLRQFIDDGYLPTWEDYRMLGVKAESGDDEETIQYSEQYAQLCEELAIPDTLRFKSSFVNAAKDLVKNIIVNFLRYHIQDRSVAVDMAPDLFDEEEQADGSMKRVPLYINDFESMTRNPKNGRFFPIKVDFSNKQMTVTDASGEVHHVVKDNDLYNIICREYWIKGAGSPATATIYSTSDAVVHQIDSPLQSPLVNKTMNPWRQQIKELIGRE
jgi:hypothetical protein